MKSENKTQKEIVYVDMDNVLVDFPHGIESISEEDRIKYKGKYDECPNIFSLMRPLPGAIESFQILAEKFDTYILSTAPWNNPSGWIHKVEWGPETFRKNKRHTRLQTINPISS